MPENVTVAVEPVPEVAVVAAVVVRWAMYMLPLIRRLRKNDDPITAVPVVLTFPDGSCWYAVAATIERNTSFVPAENVTAAFELDEL
jgi:hypothetical protein